MQAWAGRRGCPPWAACGQRSQVMKGTASPDLQTARRDAWGRGCVPCPGLAVLLGAVDVPTKDLLLEGKWPDCVLGKEALPAWTDLESG